MAGAGSYVSDSGKQPQRFPSLNSHVFVSVTIQCTLTAKDPKPKFLYTTQSMVMLKMSR